MFNFSVVGRSIDRSFDRQKEAGYTRNNVKLWTSTAVARLNQGHFTPGLDAWEVCIRSQRQFRDAKRNWKMERQDKII